jgi:hypothetical protein
MRRFLLYSVAALAVAVGPSTAIAQCGTEDCGVGATGQGGESSEKPLAPVLDSNSTTSKSGNDFGKLHGDQKPAVVESHPDIPVLHTPGILCEGGCMALKSLPY